MRDWETQTPLQHVNKQWEIEKHKPPYNMWINNERLRNTNPTTTCEWTMRDWETQTPL
jgi:hypothetical protein